MTKRQRVVTVCYEDRGGDRKEFGLHNLLLACLEDRRTAANKVHLLDRWILAQCVEKQPKKGDSRLLQAVCRRLEVTAPDCHSVVALFDDDQVRRLLGMKGEATGESVVSEIRRRSAAASPGSRLDKLQVVLLERNMETVLREAASALQAAGLPSEHAAKVKRGHKPKPDVRDALLGDLAKRGQTEGEQAARRQVRASVLKRIPSLEALVALVDSLLDAHFSATGKPSPCP